MSEVNVFDKIVEVDLEEQMRTSYIDYAMSVIVARALPDVRDGLKPVHRRILYAMNELNLDPSKAYKKSARIVGDTMGKYHPHGESSIYDAMVRMAQDFSIRYPLVDGHGNFGSMDGDGAAAQRYTEARLSRICMEMLADIEKDTVDFIPNYDGEFQEPVVLPSRFPNLLVNGSSGIAVGMATNIPPHNLSECIDALTLIIDNRLGGRGTGMEEVLGVIKGPDFPTGASILGTSGLRQAYRTGRGKVTVRATASIEPMPGASGRDMIVVSEIPYQVNKAKLVERMGELVKERKVEGVTDLRDESNREGVRIVIELRKDANANVILNQFYKYSSLQENFSIIMLALVNNEAKILNVKQMLEHYLDHQKDVLLRRSRFELNKALKRAHILEGLLIALDHIDEVISIIRSSPDAATARGRLSERFELTDEQSSAIVEMRLRALTGLERGRLEQEYAQLRAQIEELQKILGDERRMYEVVREELAAIKEKYGDARKTRIERGGAEEIEIEDLIDEEDSVVTMTRLDYIKRLPLSTYKSQNRGGKGIIGMQTREEDIVKNMFVASTHDEILFFTNMGRAYRIKAYEIPAAGRTARGMAIVNLLNMNGGEKTAAVIPVSGGDYSGCLMMLTKRGLVKKTSLDHFANIKRAGLNALNIRDDDELIAVLRVEEGQELFMATAEGYGIRFSESQIRTMGRQASGVGGIRLRGGDFVVGGGIMAEGGQILFVSEQGIGRCTGADKFTAHHRNGKGMIVYKVTPKTGKVAAVCPVTGREELMLITSEGVIIRIRVADISVSGRYSSGVKLIDLADGVTVAGVARIAEDQLEAAKAGDEGEAAGEAGLDDEAGPPDEAGLYDETEPSDEIELDDETEPSDETGSVDETESGGVVDESPDEE